MADDVVEDVAEDVADIVADESEGGQAAVGQVPTAVCLWSHDMKQLYLVR